LLKKTQISVEARQGHTVQLILYPYPGRCKVWEGFPTKGKKQKNMNQFKQMICPVSPERVDENRVRATAFGVVVTMGFFLMTQWWIFPALLALDFLIRAFTKLTYSPISWLGHMFVRTIGPDPVWIDKAPKIFAARIGFLFSVLTLAGALLGLTLFSFITASTLVIFAFLECGLNFCMGCWVYTYVVYPLVRKR
jgi:hypothetical protein